MASPARIHLACGLDDRMLAREEALIGRLADGRLRVVGVRLWHGPNLPWADELEEIAAWREEHPERRGCRSDAVDFASQRTPPRDRKPTTTGPREAGHLP